MELSDLSILFLTIVGVGVLSSIIIFTRAASFVSPEFLEENDIGGVRRNLLMFYGLFIPFLAGVVSYFLYSSMYTKAPTTAPGTFLLISIGIAVFLTLVSSNVIKLRSFVELFSLHVIYALGFGWIMPMLLAQ